MPRDPGSAKAQAKVLKAAGLQKLKYYCQICRKQCRDANGFKSHLGSPSHMGRIGDLSKDGKGAGVVNEFLREFEREFLRLLKTNHGTKKVDANKIYQEYILYDKNHVHMNATRWSSLTAFVKHLGQLGKVRVDTNADLEEFNLVIQYIDDSYVVSNTVAAKTDDQTLMKFINAQIEAGRRLMEEKEIEEKAGGKEGGKEGEKEEQIQRKSAPVALSLKGLKTKRTSAPAVFENDSDIE